jgi:hypothetical protein
MRARFRLSMAAALLLFSGCGEEGTPVVVPPPLSVAITRADSVVIGYATFGRLDCSYPVEFRAEGAGEGRWTTVVLTTSEPGVPDAVQRWDTPEGMRHVFGAPEIKVPYGFVRVFTVSGKSGLKTHMRFVYQDPTGVSRELVHTARCAVPAP